ncbi:hypothetical protein C4D60_Mb06t06550 [Musa balbisiana]|uniref:Uncharacterized protein n=1 Tax=Musa balbisiana TaxID=52838 RepID=A0A4S8INJ0_MUSBA|nr:hypothetical protein C4D60_Mb06t06550 [Musa balbisiana]
MPCMMVGMMVGVRHLDLNTSCDSGGRASDLHTLGEGEGQSFDLALRIGGIPISISTALVYPSVSTSASASSCSDVARVFVVCPLTLRMVSSQAPTPVTSPVPIQWYPMLSALFLLVGLLVTASFFM